MISFAARQSARARIASAASPVAAAAMRSTWASTVSCGTGTRTVTYTVPSGSWSSTAFTASPRRVSPVTCPIAGGRRSPSTVSTRIAVRSKTHAPRPASERGCA